MRQKHPERIPNARPIRHRPQQKVGFFSLSSASRLEFIRRSAEVRTSSSFSVVERRDVKVADMLLAGAGKCRRARVLMLAMMMMMMMMTMLITSCAARAEPATDDGCRRAIRQVISSRL